VSRYKYAVPHIVRQTLKHELRCYKDNKKIAAAYTDRGDRGGLTISAVNRIAATVQAISAELDTLDKFQRAVITYCLIDCRCTVEAVDTRLPISPSQAYVIINNFLGALAHRLGYVQ